VLLDYSCSFAIPVAVIQAHRHAGSYWGNPDTDADFCGHCGHCGHCGA
jgi:hypothetical protein